MPDNTLILPIFRCVEKRFRLVHYALVAVGGVYHVAHIVDAVAASVFCLQVVESLYCADAVGERRQQDHADARAACHIFYQLLKERLVFMAAVNSLRLLTRQCFFLRLDDDEVAAM